MPMGIGNKVLLTPEIIIREMARLLGIDVCDVILDSGNDFGASAMAGNTMISTKAKYDVKTDILYLLILVITHDQTTANNFRLYDLTRSLDDFAEKFLAPIAVSCNQCGNSRAK